jgi:asparagine synthase (glutamine-hydrolysing)
MCGIIGIASSNKPIQDKRWLSLGRDTMIHRGPDDFGEWWSKDEMVGLGHRRLSIIDITSGGHQPMLDTSENLSIVFNGEIYNYIELKEHLVKKGYAFKSSSDTEVLLNAYIEWDIDLLKHLNGMFSFCIYDIRKKRIFIARDRAGEKPLFYHLKNGILQFSSELKAILNDKNLEKKLDLDSFDCFLSMGFVPGKRSIIESVNKLPPAHYLEFNLENGIIEITKYWNIPEFINSDIEEQDLLKELDFLLEDSVNKQMVADVQVGVLLSGGVDSSIITAMAARSSSKIKTFTIRFPGYSQYDETKHARLIANYFDTEHIELIASEATVDLLPLLAKQFDEPIIDSSMVPTYLVSKLIKNHCTVALGGDGGDELFGGYGHHSRLLNLQEKIGLVPKGIRSNIAKIAENFLPVGFKGRNWLQGLDVDLQNSLPLIASYFDRSIRNKIILNRHLPLSAETIRQSRIPITKDILQRATRMDFENYLPEDILVKVDRASMINSLEVRAPFLDYRLIEFAYSKVPSRLKATKFDKKILLKSLAKQILPKEFDYSRKQGFSIPLSSWLNGGPWLKYFEEVLLSSNDSLFDKKEVLKLINGQKAGRSNSERLFALVLFELWRKEYEISF